MAQGDLVLATQLTAITTVAKVFSFSGAEIVTLNPGEKAFVDVEFGLSTGTTDGGIITIVESLVASPGTVPVAFPNANDDWAIVQQFSIAVGDEDVRKYIVLSDIFKWAMILDREAGGADTLTGDASYRKTGVNL